MATIKQLLEALNTKAAVVSTAALAKELGSTEKPLLTQLKREKEKGNVSGSSEEGWLIVDKGKKALEEGIHPTMIEEGVTPRQRFEAIGQRIGIPGDRIVLAADIVWSADYNDIKWVWEALGQADIANDLRSVWVNAWRAKLHKAIPPELEVALTGATKSAAAEGETGMTRAKGPDRDWILVDEEPVRVGAGLGDYGLQDAKDIMAIRALKSRFAGTAQAGGGQSSATEKVSELLTAMEPYINKGADLTALKETLAAQLEQMKQELMGKIPQQGASPLPKSWIDQLTELSSALPMLKSILGVPEASANPLSGIPVTVTGPDGKPAVMDFSQVLDMRKFMAEEKRADESHETKMEVAKGFKDLLGKAGTALSNMAEGEEEK